MFIERFILHAEAGAGTASGFVQSMLASLLSRWDMDGWVTCELAEVLCLRAS